MYPNEHKNYMFKKMWKVNEKTKKLELCFKRNAYYLQRYERHEVAKLCKVLQILAQSSLSLISDFVRTQSGRQDSNLRPSAPKAPAKTRL